MRVLQDIIYDMISGKNCLKNAVIDSVKKRLTVGNSNLPLCLQTDFMKNSLKPQDELSLLVCTDLKYNLRDNENIYKIPIDDSLTTINSATMEVA